MHRVSRPKSAPLRRNRLWVCFIVLATLLSGCTTTQPLPEINNWDTYQARLSQLESWKLQGKLGVRLPDDSNSVYVDWEQAPKDYAIRLSGPLGQGTTWIRGSDETVSLEQAGHAPLSAETPEELIYNALGWNLPISDLFYWVRGIPAPRTHITNQEKTEAGALAFLEQAGWQLTYSRYNAVGPWQLPGKIVARRDALKLTLVIKEWHLPEN